MKKQSAVVRRSASIKSVLFAAIIVAGLGISAETVLAAPASKACATNAANQQLDYWLGNWTVTYPGASGSGASKVYLALDKCMVVESWDDGQGHTGENMFAYSADDKTWRGMFADNDGRVHIFVKGKVGLDSAEFYGPSLGQRGEAVLNRIQVVRVTPEKVEQIWGKSTDNGATWSTVFRGEYTRTNR
jgi:hypothetical protein